MADIPSRREAKVARRRDLDGTGPTRQERPALRFPGATARFALLGEVMLTGLLITVVSIPLVTLPVALAAGIRHLRRFAAAEDSRQALFWADVRAGLFPGAVVGLGVVTATLVLLLDIDLANSGFLPAGEAIAVVGWIGLCAVAVALLGAASAWSPETGWVAAVKATPGLVRRDPFAAAYFVAAAGFVVVATWMLVPLVIPAIGCAALAVVAVPTRRRVRSQDDS